MIWTPFFLYAVLLLHICNSCATCVKIARQAERHESKLFCEDFSFFTRLGPAGGGKNPQSGKAPLAKPSGGHVKVSKKGAVADALMHEACALARHDFTQQA